MTECETSRISYVPIGQYYYYYYYSVTPHTTPAESSAIPSDARNSEVT